MFQNAVCAAGRPSQVRCDAINRHKHNTLILHLTSICSCPSELDLEWFSVSLRANTTCPAACLRYMRLSPVWGFAAMSSIWPCMLITSHQNSAFPVTFVAVTFTNSTLVISALSPLVSLHLLRLFCHCFQKHSAWLQQLQLQTAEPMHLCSISNPLCCQKPKLRLLKAVTQTEAS